MDPHAESRSTRADPTFEQFLLAEYDHIANAHFSTVNSISSFFQYYLIIASLPFSAVAVFLGLSNFGDVGFALTFDIRLFLTLITVAVALVGLCVLGYISNLRLDALLYARTVNGVRDYFWTVAELAPVIEKRIRVLPRDIAKPAYWEPKYFLLVVVAFAILDTAYLTAGLFVHDPVVFSAYGFFAIAVPVVFFGVHFLLYRLVCGWRQGGDEVNRG